MKKKKNRVHSQSIYPVPRHKWNSCTVWVQEVSLPTYQGWLLEIHLRGQGDLNSQICEGKV